MLRKHNNNIPRVKIIKKASKTKAVLEKMPSHYKFVLLDSVIPNRNDSKYQIYYINLFVILLEIQYFLKL